MPKTPSTIGLHLRYRIWIGEMNADISTLRIFDDYLLELAQIKNDPKVKSIAESFNSQFASLRQQIDLLKHEMHLQKMKLAASAREGKAIDKKIYKEENHAGLKKQYYSYQKLFSKMKNEFGLIPYNWID